MWFSFLFFYFLEMKVICHFVLYLNCIWCYTGGTSVYYRRSIVVLLFLKHIFVHGWLPCLAYFNWSTLSRNWSCQPHDNLFGICRVLVQTFYPIMLQLRRCQQSMSRYTELFIKYAGYYSQEYHEWKGSFVDWLRSFSQG